MLIDFKHISPFCLSTVCRAMENKLSEHIKSFSFYIMYLLYPTRWVFSITSQRVKDKIKIHTTRWIKIIYGRSYMSSFHVLYCTFLRKFAIVSHTCRYWDTVFRCILYIVINIALLLHSHNIPHPVSKYKDAFGARI